MKKQIGFLMALLAFAAHSAERKPDIVVVLCDDMGYSSVGCFGGEIQTPNIDRLADTGMRFSQFYNCAKCTSTRISIMSGQYEGRAGGRALKHSVSMGEALRPLGYRTIAVGKWHLDEKKDPTQYGFDRHFGHLNGLCNYFTGNEHYWKNGKPFKKFPKDFYATDAFTDFSIESIKESIAEAPERPFFLYLAYNAPHGPLHCKQQDFEKYAETYKVGWDKIRAARYQRQTEMGLIDPKWNLSLRPDFIPTWDQLPEPEKAVQAKIMAAYAGIVDNVDQNVGRLVEYLKEAGRWENTLFIFLSDNGASPFMNPKFKNREPWDPASTINVGVGWANADNTPFGWFKQNQHEGGISTPAIVHWPATIKEQGTINDEPLHVMDVLPTLLDVSGGRYPKSFPDREIRAPSGKSFLALLQGENKKIHDELFFQYSINRALRVGDWKIASARNGPWELYNLADDRTETQNLATGFPERIKAMQARWHEMAKSVTKVNDKYSKPVGDSIIEWGKDQKNVKKKDPRQGTPGNFHEMGKKKKK
ncbi:Arylsulfatase [Pontiella desulfatans]|uniref:Arylsulfatase n=1 Tax=Pontiella desulfatans TaxID=2750659 RepID=A0A6C2U1Q4_PONDE|nr:arylsulfatase [Pontiella desulfatans]SPS73815.1 sulfatase S1_4 [Kiritimatiellales bacterium]VGO13521.1 Arylsulfatase [Pontiella desulfatans]